MELKKVLNEISELIKMNDNLHHLLSSDELQFVQAELSPARMSLNSIARKLLYLEREIENSL